MIVGGTVLGVSGGEIEVVVGVVVVIGVCGFGGVGGGVVVRCCAQVISRCRSRGRLVTGIAVVSFVAVIGVVVAWVMLGVELWGVLVLGGVGVIVNP